MKRILIPIFMFFILLSGILSGCDAKETQKTEEELRAEIRTELEAEAKETGTLKAPSHTTLQTQAPEPTTAQTTENTRETVKLPQDFDQKQVENDYTQGYTCQVSNGTLSITFNNTGKIVTPVKYNQFTNVIWNGSEQELSLSEVKSVNKNDDGSRLYFSIGAIEGIYPITLYIDIATMKIYWVNEGEYAMEASIDNTTYVVLSYKNQSYPTSYSVYDLTGNLIGHLSDEPDKSSIETQITQAKEELALALKNIPHIAQGNLQGFTNETVYDETVNYDEYRSVIIPMYPSNGKNIELLGKKSYIDDINGMSLNFAVFGKMQSITITKYVNGESSGEVWDLGEIENTVVDISSSLPTDMSNYRISGQVCLSDGTYANVEFALDDMREPSDYDIIPVMDEDYEGDIGW